MVNESEYNSGRIIVDTHVGSATDTNRPRPTVGIALCLNDFEFINRVSIDTEGVSLIELGATDAHKAYAIAKSSLYHLLKANTPPIIINGNAIADEHDATSEELAMIGQTSIDTILPDEHTSEFDCTIGIYPSVLDVHILKSDPALSIPMVEMRVAPPDIAG